MKSRSTNFININRNRGGLVSGRDLPTNFGSKELIREYFNAIVVDVCLGDDSELYTSDSSVGIIIFSLENDSSYYGIAKPLFSGFRDYPVIGEGVRITENTYSYDSGENIVEVTEYYYQKVALKNNIANDETLSISQKNESLYDLFKGVCKNIVKKILHTKIGEKTIESRFNSAIKLGYKVGKDSEQTLSEIKLINNNVESREFFDDDGSSIYLTSGEDFSFSNTKLNEDVYEEPNNNKNVIATNSDNTIINSRNNTDILSERKVNVHSDKVNISANKTNIISEQINLGGEDSENYAVLFNELKEILDEIIDGITQITVPVPSLGVSSPPVNSSVFFNIKMKLNNIKSKTVKIKE